MAGGDTEARFSWFDPDAWPGASDYERYEAWKAAREEWAVKNLPGGIADLPSTLGGYVPDMPWDGTGIDHPQRLGVNVAAGCNKASAESMAGSPTRSGAMIRQRRQPV